MKRPVFWLALPVIAMCIAGVMTRANPFSVFLTFALSAGVFYCYLKRKAKRNPFGSIKKIFFPWFVILIFFLIIIINNLSLPKTIIKINDTGEAVEADFTGVVSRFTKKEEYMSVHLKDVRINPEEQGENIGGVLVYCAPQDLRLGDTVGFSGKLKPLEKPCMEGCFDEKSYYESLRIFSKCNAGELQVLSHDRNPVTVLANTVKTYLYDSFSEISPEYAGRLSAITLGDQSLLEEDIKESYRKNGIGHLLAISGLHVSITGMFIYKLLRRCGVSFTVSVIIGSAVILVYTVLTGASVSSVRAGVMFFLSVAADIPGRTYDPLSSLFLQCMITILINPYSIRGPSFLLSYIAVLSISLFSVSGNCTRAALDKSFFSKLIFKDLLVSCAVFFGLLPVNLLFYNEAPVYSVLLNLIVIPLSPFVLGLGFAAGFAGGIFPLAGRFLIAVPERIFDFYDYLCVLFEKVFGGFVIVGRPLVWQVVVYYLLLVLFYFLFKRRIVNEVDLAYKKSLLADSKNRKKLFDKLKIPGVLSIAVMIGGVFLLGAAPGEDFYVTMLSVGQGDCVLVHTKNGRNLLFDGGSGDINNVYSKRVEPYLKSKGIRKIDAVLISHTDKDHIAAVSDMIEKGNIRVSNVVLPDIDDEYRDEAYRGIEISAKNKGITLSYAAGGFEITEGEYSVKCLYPGKNEGFSDINSLSGVFRFEYKDFSMLFTGDITEEAERKMLRDGKVEQVTVLKVAHHGSNYSSCDEFLTAAAPELAIISCGVNNRYGHPGAKTIERLNTHSIPYKVTAASGAITLRPVGDGVSVYEHLE